MVRRGHPKRSGADLNGRVVGLAHEEVSEVRMDHYSRWKAVVVLMFLWEAKGCELIYGRDQIGMIMPWAVVVTGMLGTYTQTL